MTSGVPSRRPSPPHPTNGFVPPFSAHAIGPRIKGMREGEGEGELYVLVSFERKDVYVYGVLYTAGFLFQEIFNECEK